MNKNLIIFNSKKLTLNINNSDDKNCIDIRKKNSYYEKIINNYNINKTENNINKEKYNNYDLY